VEPHPEWGRQDQCREGIPGHLRSSIGGGSRAPPATRPRSTGRRAGAWPRSTASSPPGTSSGHGRRWRGGAR